MMKHLSFSSGRSGTARSLSTSLVLALSVFGCADVDERASSTEQPAQETLRAEADVAPAAAAEPECDEVYELRARGTQPDSPYIVPAGGEVHPQVILDAPWGNERVQAINFKPISDNKKVLHHWILYAGMGMLTGWAPGDDEEVPFPSDVGMDMPTGARSLRLDMHYYNTAGTKPEPDRSGVAVCIVKGAHLRKNSAAIAMGLTALNPVLAPANKKGHEATGSCTARTTQPVRLLTASPHAHKYARHMKFTVRKPSGQEIVMHDMPFQFGEQGTYALEPPVVIETGDVITTTCTYDNETSRNITFGESTENEMCFNFAVYYPKGAFTCGGFGARGR